MNRVKVRVPATTANIGPGFDCLGCALSLYARFECEKTGAGLTITGCPEQYRNEDNLFVRAYRYTERMIGAEAASLKVHIETDVPVSRGLGSSATLLAGGAMAANALNGMPLSREEIAAICSTLEGHPDNTSPAVFGGMCVSFMKDGAPCTEKISVAKNVGFVALIPNFETRTEDMRAALPPQVSRADAVFNISRIAVLLRAFERGDMERISIALEDRIHEPYRRPLIHEFNRAETAAKQAGCPAFCISGSGSTLLGIADAGSMAEIVPGIQRALKDSSYDWKILPLTIDLEGALVQKGD